MQINLVSNQEQETMRKIFQSMDKNFDGVLTRDEVVGGLKKMGSKDPEDEADHIFEVADTDENGNIEFSEFCTAAMDKAVLLHRPRLEAAFNMFDKNKNGKISFQELKEMLKGNEGFTDEIFVELIGECDIDGDGEIDFQEFEKMMMLAVQKK